MAVSGYVNGVTFTPTQKAEGVGTLPQYPANSIRTCNRYFSNKHIVRLVGETKDLMYRSSGSDGTHPCRDAVSTIDQIPYLIFGVYAERP